MGGAVLPLSLYVLMACTGTALRSLVHHFFVCFTFYLECTAWRVIFVPFALLKAVVLTSPVSSDVLLPYLASTPKDLKSDKGCLVSIILHV